jgi:hypothetical protein
VLLLATTDRAWSSTGKYGQHLPLSLGAKKGPILLKNSVLRAARKFAKNFVLSCAHPFTLISATELRQEVFS